MHYYLVCFNALLVGTDLVYATLVLQSPRSERLAAHHDPSSTPWWLDEAWEGMNPEEWEEVTYELITTSCTAYWDGGITGVDNVQLI